MNGAKLKAPNAHPASRCFMIVGTRAPCEPVQSGRHASRFKRRNFGFNVQLWRPDDDATARRGVPATLRRLCDGTVPHCAKMVAAATEAGYDTALTTDVFAVSASCALLRKGKKHHGQQNHYQLRDHRLDPHADHVGCAADHA
jgi:hypothetical protein